MGRMGLLVPAEPIMLCQASRACHQAGTRTSESFGLLGMLVSDTGQRCRPTPPLDPLAWAGIEQERPSGGVSGTEALPTVGP